ncbi:MAG: mandelate racemase [Limimaricola sp.]|uniref:enolase C-terminal domain-like protein n=1 Tax=Limimaricola sp. TaxID=2211665 RepID=UPI001D406CB1|nr:enolase C-terminal domain-like protein [Limimaricola sp.]MBI1416761.1 mandelate racemase [Limimaricola sp.]
MQIARVDIRACRHRGAALGADALRDGQARAGLDYLVYTVTTEGGQSASMFGFAARSALGAGHLAAASLRPFFVGRNALDREAAWQDWRVADRWWHHLPIYSYGPLDCCLWILAAEAAGKPLWRYIGGLRSEVPVYASSLVLPDADAYVAEARAVQAAGLRAYKVHPPGKSLAQDIEIHRAVRDAVGPDFPLMSDPVAPYTLDEALRLGRELERLGYLWLEEPLPDENFAALRELTRALDIPVIGTEVLPKHPYSVAECLATRVVDGVRADPSWSGGITGTLKTARLAEAFHAPCELHTTIFQPLELVNLHLNGAIGNSRYLELLWPAETFAFGLAAPLPVANGIATMPQGPGLGIALDWDMIDNDTLEVL